MEPEFEGLKLQFRKLKLAVRRAHWKKPMSNEEKVLLNTNPADLIKRLTRAENFQELFKAKLDYYALIIENEARPTDDYVPIRRKIDRLLDKVYTRRRPVPNIAN